MTRPIEIEHSDPIQLAFRTDDGGWAYVDLAGEPEPFEERGIVVERVPGTDRYVIGYKAIDSVSGSEMTREMDIRSSDLSSQPVYVDVLTTKPEARWSKEPGNALLEIDEHIGKYLDTEVRSAWIAVWDNTASGMELQDLVLSIADPYRAPGLTSLVNKAGEIDVSIEGESVRVSPEAMAALMMSNGTPQSLAALLQNPTNHQDLFNTLELVGVDQDNPLDRAAVELDGLRVDEHGAEAIVAFAMDVHAAGVPLELVNEALSAGVEKNWTTSADGILLPSRDTLADLYEGRIREDEVRRANRKEIQQFFAWAQGDVWGRVVAEVHVNENHETEQISVDTVFGTVGSDMADIELGHDMAFSLTRQDQEKARELLRDPDCSRQVKRGVLDVVKAEPSQARSDSLDSVIDLRGADLRHADFRDMSITNVNLDGADLTDACFIGARFEGVSLQNVRTDNTTFQDTVFDERCDLSGVDLDNTHTVNVCDLSQTMHQNKNTTPSVKALPA